MPLSFPKRFHKTLGFRLSVWYASIFILCSLIFSLVSYLFVFSTVRDNRDAIRSKLAYYKTLAESKGLAAITDAVSEERGPSRRTTFFVRIAAPGNQTLFVSHPWLWEPFDYSDPEKALLEAQWQYYTSKRDGDLLEVLSAHLRSGAVLQVGKSIQDRKDVLEHFRDTLLATTIPMVLIGLTGGILLTFRALMPIHNLSVVARSIVNTGRFDARVPDNKAGDELNELVVLFNQMLARIQALIGGMRDALDNVAHDLRTPVARLRGVAEQALRSEGDSRAKHEALADCLEESERIMAMLNTLMDISEAESGAMKLALEDVNLSSVIDEVVDLYRYMAEDRLISLSFQSPGGLYLRADRARLRQVLANLIDNALKYTPGGGHVHIDARQTNGYIIIAVEDTGVGISSEEMPRIWDRLYRGDKSRSERGLGLGLSLVKAVVQAHGGRVTAAPNSPVGSCFTVYLPLNSVDSAISLPHLSKM